MPAPPPPAGSLRAAERSVLITLTEQGSALQERARSIPAYIATAAGLTPAEFEELRVLLRKLTANATQATEAHGAAARPLT